MDAALSQLRKIIGTALAVLGLAGLSDNFVAWESFAYDIVEHYRTFRDVIFDYLPFNVPELLRDYIVAGCGFVAFITGFIRRVDMQYEGGVARFGQESARYSAIAVLGVLWPIWAPVVLVVLLRDICISTTTDPEIRLKQRKRAIRDAYLVFSPYAYILIAMFLFADFRANVFGGP